MDGCADGGGGWQCFRRNHLDSKVANDSGDTKGIRRLMFGAEYVVDGPLTKAEADIEEALYAL